MTTLYNTRNDILNLLPKQIVFAEIGVFKGNFSKDIFSIVNPSHLYLVDIFEGVVGSGDKDGNNFECADLSHEYQNIKNYFADNKNVEVIKSDSESFLLSLPDDHLDAVYIDAEHTYDFVIKELELSFQKVKNGGYIMGHDYCERFHGVIQAVTEFCNKYNQQISMLTQDGCPTFVIKKTKV